MKRRLLCLLLCLSILVNAAPLSAFAMEKNASHTFKDVTQNDWFYDPIKYAVENNIFSGTDKDTFSPNDPMTRAMYVTVMGHIAGIGDEYSIKEGLFSDVKQNAYYAPYVMWALEKGISQGVGNNKFSPNSLITREQMATLTVNFFDAYGIPYPESTNKADPKDLDKISDYAKSAVIKLWSCGLLMGDKQGNFNPKKNATRAEAAAFTRGINKAVVSFRENTTTPKPDTTPKPKPDTKPKQPDSTPKPNENTGDSNGSGGSVQYYNITYVTNGGNEIQTQRLPSGSSLRDLPIPYKENEIFSGWYYDAKLENHVLNSDVIRQDITLYAKYGDIAPLAEAQTPSFASALDQGTDFTITVVSSKYMTADQVKDAITAKNLSSLDQSDFIKVIGDGTTFTISGKEGFEEGGTYKITLEDKDLNFQGLETSIRDYNFTIAKKDVMNLTLSKDMSYIPLNEVSDITQNGKSVKSLSTPLVSVGSNSKSVLSDLTEGTFTYSGNLKVGDNVTIYEGIRPDQRVLDDTRTGADGAIAYLTITAVNGNTYSYKSAEVEDVLFEPDVLPVPNTADTDGNSANNSITVNEDVMEFSDDIYSPMELDSQTTVDVGDYLAFYEGKFSANSNVTKYGCITSVSKENGLMVITYTDATMDQIISAMDMYNTDPLDGDTLLEKVDVAALESNVEQQARDSGFAEEAAMYLSELALKTDSFTKLSDDIQLNDFQVSSKDGTPLNTEELRLMAGDSKVEVELNKLQANISTKLKHFDTSGVRLTLDVGVEIKIEVNDDTEIVINVTGSFEEEVHIAINVDGGAKWKWWGIFPYISEYEVTTNIDLFNFTGIGINASMVTKEKVDNKWTENKELQKITDELKKLLDEKDKYIGDGEGTVTDGLTDKYKAMLETESDWVNLFEKEIYSYEYRIPPIFILVVEFSVKFAVTANMNISIGCDFYYENAKRYSYTVQVFAKNVTSDVIDIREEHYEFTFYVMGTMGIRAGIKAEFKVGLISTKLASVGFSAEAGVYVRLWGYFYYKLEYTASKGRSSSYAGALYFELGIYLEIKFEAQAFAGTFSYNPTLYENEWPLWSAGMRENVQDFGYEETSEFTLKKHIRKLTVPDEVFNMSYMDLKTGDVEEKIFDDAKYFTIELTNKAFSYDPVTNILSITPDEGDFIEEGEMIITWAGAPLAFTSAPITRTFDLYWDNLNNGYAIIFNTNGGNTVPMIIKRYNAPVTAPAEPTKIGYNFAGWYTDSTFSTPYVIPATMPNVDTVVYAKWIPRDDTPYTVEHYQQNLNNNMYTRVDSDTQRLYGTTDSSVTPEPKAYVGFNTAKAQNLTVTPDGSGVLKYYYSRGSYTITFDPGQAGGEPTVYKYQYGKTITAPQISMTGYTFIGWDKKVPEIMPAENMTFVAQWSPVEDTAYRIEHYIQITNGESYTLSQIEQKRGKTNAELKVQDFVVALEGITFEKSTVDGLVTQSTKIKGNGTLVVKLYYTRNKHTVSFVVENGNTIAKTYRYGEIVTPPITPAKDGYTFSGWKTNSDMKEEFVFGKPLPNMDLTVYGALIPNNGTKYIVEHYYQNTTGVGYNLNMSEQKSGTTDEKLDLADFAVTAEGVTFEKATVNGQTTETTQITGDGTLVVKLYYTRNKHTVSFVVENGNNIEKAYHYGEIVERPTTPTKEGYTFSGWKADKELKEEFVFGKAMPAKNITVYGALVPNSNTTYRVEHYLQNTVGGGYTLVDADNSIGVTDTETMAVAKTYTGFTAKVFKQDTISGDGRTVIRIDYDRNTYNVELDTAGGTIHSGNVKEYVYGVGAQLPTDITRAGYIFSGWFDGISGATNISTSDTGDKRYIAKWSPASNTTYTVKHLREDLNGKYTIVEIEGKNGTTDTDTAASARDYKGFTTCSFNQSKISGDGSTVIEILYNRNSYSLSWNLIKGSLEGNYTNGSVKFGTPITQPDMKRDGYTFSGWFSNSGLENKYTIPAYMPAEDISVYGTLAANSGISYKIMHYRQNADDNGYTLYETDALTGSTDDEVTGLEKDYENFYFNGNAPQTLLSGKIKADGSLVLRLYYDRKTFTADYLVDGEPYSGQAVYKYGQTVAYPAAPQKEGYFFDTWKLDGESFTGSMPGRDITLEASWCAGEKSYTVRYYLEKINYNNEAERWELIPEDSSIKSDIFDETITVIPEKVYTGFSTPEEQVVTLNSNLSTVDFKYARNSYRLTWNLNGGTPTNDYTTSSAIKFNAPIVAPILIMTGNHYTWDKEIAVTMPDTDMEYTANWMANTYTVGFSEQGFEDITVTYGDSYGDLPEVSKIGYTFDGWFTAASGGEKIEYSSKVAIPKDHVLYAHWSVNSYTLDWNLNGGTASNSYTSGNVAYGTSLIVPAPVKTGYDFAGWDKEISTTMPTENLTYNANWTPKTYTVQFNETGYNSITVTYDKTYGALPVPSKTGYIFDGWYTNAVDGDRISEDSVVKIIADQIIYAHWKAEVYKLIWDLSGGTAQGDYTNGNVAYGASLIAPVPSKIGYEFTGWDKEIAKNMPAENLTYTANWKPKSFIVTLNPNGGTINNGSIGEYTYGVGATLPTDVMRQGYTFEGWYDGETRADSILKTDLGDKNYIAKWSVNSYNITYHNMDGATNHGNNTDNYTFGTGLTLGNPEKTGYDFVGWYTDSGFKTHITSISTSDMGKIDLYAKWVPKIYNVILATDGGTLSVGSDITSYTYGTVAVLPTSDKINKAGYTFTGWTDGTKIVTEIPINSIGDKSYTATWELVGYGISYELNDGVNSEDNPHDYNVMSENINLADPVKEGYVFEGWFIDQNFITPIGSPAIAKGSTGSVTFYAKWRPSRYTVVFNANEGTGSMLSQSYNVNEEKALSSNTFTREGYSFAGWATSVDGGKAYGNEAKVVNLSQTDGAVVNLYAVWSIVNYTITYNLNSGTNNAANPGVYTVESQGISLKDPTRAGGYVFEGWYDNASFTGNKVTQIEAGATGNLTLYALWKHYGVFSVSVGTNNTFTITRTDGSDGTQQVYYRTQNGSAIGGTHLSHMAGSVTFDQGETTKTITITELGVSNPSASKVATRYSNADRVYFLDIYKVEGGGKLGETTRATRTMTKDSAYTVDSDALNVYKLLASVSNLNKEIYEDAGGSYKGTVYTGLSSPVFVDDSKYSPSLRTYIRDTASAMKIKLSGFYGKDDGWRMYRFVLFNNQSQDATFSGSKETTIPDLPSITKCALVYGITADTNNTDNYGVNFPAYKGSLSATGTSNPVSISDIKWASGQDGGDYVLYGFDETCGISVGAYNSATANSMWHFNSASLYALPKDVKEPTLLDVAPMANATLNDGDKVIISLIFDEIVNSADNVSIKTMLSNDSFTLKGGIGTNVLYFEGTVSGNGGTAPTKDSIFINNNDNIKDMCN